MQQRTAEILCVGTELLMGGTVNTNATEIAKELAGLGINLYHSSVVGDNPGRAGGGGKPAVCRAGYPLSTGGLGPT